MSYPTPWLFTSLDKIVDAEGHIVMEDGTRFYCNIDLDDLVSRINAGAEAEARAERAKKALEEAYRAGLAAAEHSFTEYATFSDAPMSYAACLKEKEKK